MGKYSPPIHLSEEKATTITTILPIMEIHQQYRLSYMIVLDLLWAIIITQSTLHPCSQPTDPSTDQH